MLPRLEVLLRASPNLPNFPHHYHDAQGNVTAAWLTGDPTADLQQVLRDL